MYCSELRRRVPMGGERESHSGLYTLHFSNIFPPEKTPSTNGSVTASSSPAQATPQTSSAASSGSPMHLAQWHIVVRMRVDNGTPYVRGKSELFSPTPSLASPAARGIMRDGTPVPNTTVPDGIPIVPIHQRDCLCSVSFDSCAEPENRELHYVFPLSTKVGLQVLLHQLEGAVLGLSEPEMLQDVVLSCTGYKSCGWFTGTVSVTSEGKEVQLPQTLRFVFRPCYGRRCVSCLGPVYAIGYTCERCEVPRYCSRDCMMEDLKGNHQMMCPLLRERYRYLSGEVVTLLRDGYSLIAWWRCLENGTFSVLVDPNNKLGWGVEIMLNVLKSTRNDGVSYRMIYPNPFSYTPPEDEMAEFLCHVLREVSRSAIIAGCVPLASACLDFINVFSPSLELAIQAHTQFFVLFHCENLDVPIYTVEEYVSYARPLHALANLQVNYALKGTLPLHFWSRMKFAKDAIASLLAVTNVVPTGDVGELRDVIAAQQRDALLTLSNMFVMMATRAPELDATRLLQQAERCLRQCQEEAAAMNSANVEAMMSFRLSALLLLYQEDAKTEEAKVLREKGESLLRLYNAQQAAIAGNQQSGVEEAEVGGKAAN